MLGLDLGARFLRAALCDLRGEIRARQDVELRSIGDGEPDADAVLASVAELRDSLVAAAGLDGVPIDGVVVGVPGAVEPDRDRVRLVTNVAGLEGRRFGSELGDALGLPVTVWNDINLAALGERWRGAAHGVDDFVFLSIGTGLGAGLVLRGELHRGHHGAAGELDYAAAGLDQDIDPCAAALSAVAEKLATKSGVTTALAPPYEGRAIFAAARAGDVVARVVVAEEARRIGLHIVPVAAVTDVGLVVLGGGVGANPQLLDSIRPLLDGLASISAARRDLEPRRRRGAHRRARGRAEVRSRQRLRKPARAGAGVARVRPNLSPRATSRCLAPDVAGQDSVRKGQRVRAGVAVPDRGSACPLGTRPGAWHRTWPVRTR